MSPACAGGAKPCAFGPGPRRGRCSRRGGRHAGPQGPSRLHFHSAFLPARTGGELMLAAPVGRILWNHSVGRSESIQPLSLFCSDSCSADQPGPVYGLEDGVPQGSPLAQVWTPVPHSGSSSAGHGRLDAPCTARCRHLAEPWLRHVPPGLRSLCPPPGGHHVP